MNKPPDTNVNTLHTPENTPALKRILGKMEVDVAESFTEQQLDALGSIVKVQRWQKHPIDIRTTLVFPFLPWSFYTVFLAGRNKRYLSSSEQIVAAIMLMLVFVLLGLSVFGFVFTILYLLKSALGIDLFPDHSLGVWDELKRLFD